MKKRILGIALAALLGAGGVAHAAEVPTRPFLRIETGMHTAPINRIDADAAGRFLVTGSDDKTVRVWDLGSGRLLRTLRPPIGEGEEGKIYAVAISPDGELVAAGGWTGFQWTGHQHSIYLFDRRSGRLLRRINGMPNVIDNLAFSSDGSRLAAGSNGLRVFHMPDGEEVGRDTSYVGASYSASFATDGRLVTTCEDRKIRLYDRDIHLLASVSAPAGGEPYCARFSPDGRRIAVGAYGAPRVDVLDAADLHGLYTPDARGTSGDLSDVAWSADGSVLYAAGRFSDSSGRFPIRRWLDAGRGTFQDFTGPGHAVQNLRILPEGRLAFGSADPAWGVLDATGKTVLGQQSVIADFRILDDGFRVAPGGSSGQFAYELYGRRSARFSIPERRLILDPPQDSRLSPPRTVSSGLDVTGWESTTEPRLNGQPLALESFERARSLAVAPDGQSFLLGTEWSLYSFRHDGSQRWSMSAPGIAWAVNLTGDGRLAVAAFGDGTIRWYRADNGQELLAFFPHADGKRWVLWTPSGYYDASVDGEDLIGWHVNNGSDREADFFSAWQFRDRFRKPEVIDLILQTLDETEALRRAGILPEAHRPTEIQKEELPPVVTILDPKDGAEMAASAVKVRVNVRSPSGKPVTRVWAKVDGQAIESRTAEYVPADNQAGGAARDFERDLEVPLPPRDCIVEVVAEVAGRVSTPARISVKRKAQAPPTVGRLFALVAGIADYAKAEYKLRFADADARDVASLLRGQKGKSFSAVEVRELVNEKATLESLLDGLQWLTDNVGPDDTAVVFFAGHGVNEREYYFLPYKADLAKPVVTMLSQSQLQGVLSSLRGRVLLFLDTCRAGAVFGGSDDERRRKVDVTSLLNSLTYSQGGLVVFSAAQGRELSQEREEWGHGAFTKALLEALQGGAANGNGEITINDLDTYLSDHVSALTHGAQTPIQTRPPGVPSFTFMRVAKPAK
jgi:WD40 repeat protein